SSEFSFGLSHRVYFSENLSDLRFENCIVAKNLSGEWLLFVRRCLIGQEVLSVDLHPCYGSISQICPEPQHLVQLRRAQLLSAEPNIDVPLTQERVPELSFS